MTAAEQGCARPHQQHAVVQLRAAGRVEDAAHVELEGALVGLNGHLLSLGEGQWMKS